MPDKIKIFSILSNANNNLNFILFQSKSLLGKRQKLYLAMEQKGLLNIVTNKPQLQGNQKPKWLVATAGIFIEAKFK